MRKTALLILGLIVTLVLLTTATPAMAQPSIDLSVKKGHVDEPIEVTGKGFPSGASILLKYDDTVVDSFSTRSDGTFNRPIEIPASQAGKHKVKAIRASDGVELAYDWFTVEPKLVLTPDRGLSGTIAIAEGKGYASQADITFTCTSSVGAQVTATGSGSASSGCNGRFRVAIKVTAEVTAEAKVTVRATDSRGNLAWADFTVAPAVDEVVVDQVVVDQVPPISPVPLAIIVLGVVLVVAVIILIVRTKSARVRW